MPDSNKIAVVIPCYRVKDKVLDVIKKIGPEVWRIYIVDDCCPEESGKYIKENCKDRRVQVLWNEVNLGVGGAVMTGYRKGLEENGKIFVKIDGDGQMDPSLLPQFVIPLLAGEADYTKGNRFYDFESLRQMPRFRIFGNAVLSFMAKLSTGYWDLFDPTNGYTAIHADTARLLQFEKISKRFFFRDRYSFQTQSDQGSGG